MSSSEITGRPGGSLQKAAGTSQVTNYRLAKQTRQLSEEIHARTELATVRDAGRAFATSRAMVNVSTLAMQAETHAEMCPVVAPYLDVLLRSYAAGASQQISEL